MNTSLIVWSIIAGDRRNSCRSVEELYDWCHSQSHINFQVLSSDEVLSLKPSKGMHPDLILINSRRRGEFSGKTLERVVGKYPLSLVLEITGDWCIGDTRSGHPLPIPCRFDATVGHQRLPSILSSRQRFLHMRGALNPLVSFAELSSFRRIVLVLILSRQIARSGKHYSGCLSTRDSRSICIPTCVR